MFRWICRGLALLPLIGLVIVGLVMAGPARAAEALVAVAANFAGPAKLLAADYEQADGHSVEISVGSTGKLYAQIVNGAPYDAFLAADRRRPRLLEEKDGLAVKGSRFTYALGRLALWSPAPGPDVSDGPAALRAGGFRHLAIASPRLAPYGAAAMQTLGKLGLAEALQAKIVNGENVGQTFQMVMSGNAELGFVALSQVVSPANRRPGTRWEVPATDHAPIRQDAVLLRHGRDNAAARGFLARLKGPAGRALLARYGYGAGE